MKNVERITGVSVKEWLEYVQSPHDPQAIGRTLGGDTMAPCASFATAAYKEGASKTKSSSNPESVRDGMQTIVNLARVKSEYDASDPTDKGSLKYFRLFTGIINQFPIITVEGSRTSYVTQESQDASKIIESFTDLFQGITNEDKAGIIASVTSLADAALSYSEKMQKVSQFSQILLDYDKNSKSVDLILYSSFFEIKATESKGIINYHSVYSVNEVKYKLKKSMWDKNKHFFEAATNTLLEDLLGDLITPPNPDSTAAKALCLQA